jgi:hypothetical protein
MSTSKAKRVKGKVGVPPILKKGGPMKDKTKVLPRKEKHSESHIQ